MVQTRFRQRGALHRGGGIRGEERTGPGRCAGIPPGSSPLPQRVCARRGRKASCVIFRAACRAMGNCAPRGGFGTCFPAYARRAESMPQSRRLWYIIPKETKNYKSETISNNSNRKTNNLEKDFPRRKDAFAHGGSGGSAVIARRSRAKKRRT